MNLLKKIFCRENLWNLISLFLLELIIFFLFFNLSKISVIIGICLLVLFTIIEKKRKSTLKSGWGFYLILIFADSTKWGLYAAMLYPLVCFIYQMAKKEN